jgi:acyl-CoA thioesterase I
MRALFKASLGGLFVALVSGFGVLAAAPAPAPEPPVRILALGDSLTQGYGVRTGMEFPAQLERALKAQGLNVSVINAGVSGDTSAGGLARLDWSLTPDQVGGRPEVAIVEFGGNDALRGLSPAEMEKNVDAILSRLKARKIPTLLAGMMAPRNMGAGYVAQFDAVFPRLAKKHAVAFYPFFLEGVALDRSLMQGDLHHPNEKGVAAIVARMAPAVAQLVAQAKAQRPR